FWEKSLHAPAAVTNLHHKHLARPTIPSSSTTARPAASFQRPRPDGPVSSRIILSSGPKGFSAPRILAQEDRDTREWDLHRSSPSDRTSISPRIEARTEARPAHGSSQGFR